MRKYALQWGLGCIALLSVSFNLANARAHNEGSKMALAIKAQFGQQQEKPAAQDTTVLYTCPMHKDVVKNSPGKCPNCKMDLVKKDAEKVTYTCPMHPNVTKDKPGQCPNCKMDLVEKKPVKKEVPK